MKKKIIASMLTFVPSVNLGTVAKKSRQYRSLTMLVLYGCLLILSACAPAELTPAQKLDFDQAIQQDPNNASIYFRRGHAYYQINNHQLAIEDFTRAIELDPNNARVYNSRGWCYDKLGLLERAIEDYSHAIGLDPNYASPYYNRSNARGRRGNRSLACDDLRKACELLTEQGQRQRAETACYSFKRNCK